MIERIHELPRASSGCVPSARSRVADYVDTIEPELESSRRPTTRCGCCCSSAPSSSGFGDGAWGDLTGELRQTPFHRGAVVTDDWTIRTGLAAAAVHAPRPRARFGNDDYDKAAGWVAA